MLTRRDILRGVGGSSSVNPSRIVAPALFPASMAGCRCNNSRKLNVILHGLFVLNITDRNIQLLTPKVKEHIYKVGDWHKDHIGCLDEGKYVLQGVCDAGKAPLIGTENIILSQE